MIYGETTSFCEHKFNLSAAVKELCPPFPGGVDHLKEAFRDRPVFVYRKPLKRKRHLSNNKLPSTLRHQALQWIQMPDVYLITTKPNNEEYIKDSFICNSTNVINDIIYLQFPSAVLIGQTIISVYKNE